MEKKILSLFLAGITACSACAIGSNMRVNAATDNSSITDWISYDTEHIEGTRYIAAVTGDKATTDTTVWDVGGTDLGIPFSYTYQDALGNEKKELRVLFGDTFSSKYVEGNWRSNVMGISTDTDFSDGLSFDSFVSTRSDGKATALIESPHVDQIEKTAIPTGAVQIGNAIYLYYMGVRVWGPTSDWWNNVGGVYKSTDGVNFSRVESMSVYSNKLWSMTQRYPLLVDEDQDGVKEYLYVYGLPGGRASGLRCMRVSLKNEQGVLLSGDEQQTVVENLDNYEYYNGLDADGNPTWIKYNEYYMALEWNYSTENEVVAGPCGEMNVCYNPYLGKYMATYQQYSYSRAARGGIKFSPLVMRLADNPWGPFGKTEIILSYSEFDRSYGAFTTETMLADNGKTVYFMMSHWPRDEQWNTIDYMVRLMEMRLK